MAVASDFDRNFVDGDCTTICGEFYQKSFSDRFYFDRTVLRISGVGGRGVFVCTAANAVVKKYADHAYSNPKTRGDSDSQCCGGGRARTARESGPQNVSPADDRKRDRGLDQQSSAVADAGAAGKRTAQIFVRIVCVCDRGGAVAISRVISSRRNLG